jgi:hypothetical protein
LFAVNLTVQSRKIEETMKALFAAITFGLVSSFAVAQSAPAAKPAAAAPAAAAPAAAPAAVDCKDAKNKDNAACKKK